MDQSSAPIRDALVDYRKANRYGFTPPGHQQGRGTGMNLPDPADPSLETIRVVA